MFNSKFSIRKRVMAVINQKIESEQQELEAEVRQLHDDYIEEVKKAELKLEIMSEEAVEKHVSNILKGVM
jgi:cell division protein FtsB